MRLKLMLSPTWVQGLMYGLLFGVGGMVLIRLYEGHWLGALLGGVLGGAFYDVLMAMTMSTMQARMLAGWAAGLTETELLIVVRAAGRGPAPTDQHLREAALTLVYRRQAEHRRTRPWG